MSDWLSLKKSASCNDMREWEKREQKTDNSGTIFSKSPPLICIPRDNIWTNDILALKQNQKSHIILQMSKPKQKFVATNVKLSWIKALRFYMGWLRLSVRWAQTDRKSLSTSARAGPLQKVGHSKGIFCGPLQEGGTKNALNVRNFTNFQKGYSLF